MPEHGRYFRASLGKLSEALDTFGKQKLAFILDLGDLIDRRFESFAPVLSLYRQATAPVYLTLGNHDFSVADNKKPAVPKLMQLPPGGYYDFSFQYWRFIVLNGNERSLFATQQGTTEAQESQVMLDKLVAQHAPNAMEWNGGMSAKQIGWLRAKLEEAQAQSQKVIVGGHYPLYPPGRYNLWNDEEVIAVLTQFPQVVAYINGHHHEGNYHKKSHVHYLNFKGMVETEHENAFATVAVYKDRLEVKGYGREENRMVCWSR